MMIQLYLSKKDYKNLLIILRNCNVINKNDEALKLHDKIMCQGGLLE